VRRFSPGFRGVDSQICHFSNIFNFRIERDGVVAIFPHDSFLRRIVDRSLMNFSWNRLALMIGAFILALVVVDGLVKMNQQAMADFGMGQGPLVGADSAAALFLVGLVVGMVLGIGIFFGYLVWREKRYAEEPDEVALLLEEVAAEEKRNAFHRERDRYHEESHGEEHAETLDPWERPVDWWKRSDDE
jgi:hypothetical protein